MCGRFTITKTEQELEKRFGANFYTRVLEARYNIAPTRACAVITDREPEQIDLLRWGLVPFWAKDPSIGARMINARLETVGEKPAFRQAFRRRRCLVLADGWYEWKPAGKSKQPYRIVRRDRDAFAFAGLWESWNPADKGESRDPEKDWHSFTIITQPALPAIAHIHDRMPSILLPGNERTWLQPDLPDEDLQQLLLPYPEDDLEAYPVSVAVNNARNEDKRLLEAVDPEQPSEGLFA